MSSWTSSFGHSSALHCFVFRPPTPHQPKALAPRDRRRRFASAIHRPVGPNYFQLWAEQRSHVWGETSIPPPILFFSPYQNPTQKWRTEILHWKRGGQGGLWRMYRASKFYSCTFSRLVFHIIGQEERWEIWRGSKSKRRRGLVRQGLSKLNRKVDIAKNNKSISLRCENSVGF